MSLDVHIAEVNQTLHNLSLENPTALQHDIRKLAEALLYLLENSNIREAVK